MTFERTQDYSLIRQVLTHPKIYKHISDDGSPQIADYQPPQHETFLYILVRDGNEALGLFMLHPTLTSACLEVHTCLYPTVGAKRAMEAGRQLGPWLWPQIDQQVVITHVPAYNQPAIALARAAGFKAWGRLPRAFPKFGRTHDLILLGLAKPETLCH